LHSGISLTPYFNCHHIISIAPQPHPKSAGLLQRRYAAVK
jgi:hypothetical protein